MFDYFKKASISNRANDELLYEFVLTEMENGTVSKGLWGKALANSGGDSANAKSIYMQYRVQSIKDIFTSMEIAYNELSKPKLFQYIQDKIFPMTSDYTSLVLESDIAEEESYIVSKEEEDLYEEVAKELSKNIRKEGLWLKAIQNTDGDENRALSLYIKYRSESLKAEKQILLEKQRELRNAQQAEVKRREQVLHKKRHEQLIEFLDKNKMRIVERLADGRIIANYSNTPIDAYLEYKNSKWQVVK